MGDVGYADTFIVVAEDCPVDRGTPPVGRGGRPTAATVQFEMLAGAPYEHRSEDLIFAATTLGRSLVEASEDERRVAMDAFFAKPQACLRASPLPKRWGWGLHFDGDSRVAVYGCDTDEYRRLATDPALAQLKAMRSTRR
jgi:hypothetical protein